MFLSFLNVNTYNQQSVVSALLPMIKQYSMMHHVIALCTRGFYGAS